MIIAKLISLFVVCCLLFVVSPASAQTPSTGSSQKSTDQDQSSTSSVREKVRAAIENLSKKPRAVVGTLDQITDSTIRIKTMDEKTAQIATSGNTKYAKLTGGKKTEIKFEDLVLGNFVVAMGYRNGNEILEAKRVLTFDKAPFVKKQAVLGIVQDLKKNTLTIVQNGTGDTWTIKTSSKTDVTAQATSDNAKFQEADLSDIGAGDKIVVAGTLDEKATDTIAARRIYILSVKAKASPKPSPSAAPKATVKPTQ